MRHILLYLRNVFKYAREYLCVDNEIFLKYDNLFVVSDILNREKILKAYYGFRVPYVFLFPSAGH